MRKVGKEKKEEEKEMGKWSSFPTPPGG